MAPLTVAIPGADKIGTGEAAAYNVRISRSGKPYVVWSKSASGTPASSTQSSRAETPASSARAFPVTTNASIGYVPSGWGQRGEVADGARITGTFEMQAGLSSAAAKTTSGQSQDSKGLVRLSASNAEKSEQNTSNSTPQTDQLMQQWQNGIGRQSAAALSQDLDRPFVLQKPPVFARRTQQETGMSLSDSAPAPQQTMGLQTYRSEALSVTQESAVNAADTLFQSGTNETDVPRSARNSEGQDGADNLVCDVCINKHLVESKHEQKRREREEQHRVAAEAGFRAQRAAAEWEARMAEERVNTIEKAKAVSTSTLAFSCCRTFLQRIRSRFNMKGD